MVELETIKPLELMAFGPIAPGSVLIVPEHLARRLVAARFAIERLAPSGDCECGECDVCDSGIIAEFEEE